MNAVIKYTLLFLLTSNVSFGQLSFPRESIVDYFDSKNLSPWWPKNAKSALVVRKELSNGNWNYDTTYHEFDKNSHISMLVEKHFYNNEWVRDTTIYTYNTIGLWESKTSLFDTIYRTFEYDSRNRLTQVNIGNLPQFKFTYNGDNPNPSIARFSSNYWNEYEYDSLDRIKEIHKYKDSIISEIHNYNHLDRKIEISVISTLENIYNDTTEIYVNQNNQVIKRIYKTNEFDNHGAKPVYAITSYRYDDGKVVSMTDCLTNDSSTGFSDYIYDDSGHLKEIIWHTNNGMKKTRHYIYHIEFK